MNLECECKLITPMFMGGADPLKAELRAPSIKGALRFWWRALNGHLGIPQLKETEASLFGSADSKHGRSKVLFNITINQLNGCVDPLPWQPIRVLSKGQMRSINILEYLCYGTYKWNTKTRRNEFLKEYIGPGSFSLRVRTNGTTLEQDQEIEAALYMLANFGGLGARSRNGFGSLMINKDVFRSNPETFLASLELAIGLPKYTALSSRLKLFRTNSLETWDKALAELGIAYHRSRGRLEQKHRYEKRRYLAAPLPMDKPPAPFPNRRAKPYFMHIAQVENRYEGRMLYLPSTFATGFARIDDSTADSRFAEVCNEMNEHLAQELEVVI